jgi:predicted DNA-binding transcriptional regulator YafY
VEPSEPGVESCIVTIGGDADWVARYLASLPIDFEVLEPPEVREELRTLAERLIRLNR